MNSMKRKVKSSPATITNKKIKHSPKTKTKNDAVPKKVARDEFTGSLDSAIEMLRDNCNLSEHMEELNKTPFRHIFQLISKMKRKEGTFWCKRYNNCIRHILGNYNVKKSTIKVGETEIKLTEDKVRAAFGIVDGSIEIDIDKKKSEGTQDGRDFISRCFPEKKKTVMITPKKKKEPEEGELKEDENKIEGELKEGVEGDELMLAKEFTEPIFGWDLYKKLMDNKLSSSDFARVATLYLLTWVFIPTLGFSCALRNLYFVGSMEKMCSYNWSRAILDSLNKGLERNKNTSGMKSGCVILLAYCLCEETKLIQPLNTSFPRFARWDMKQLHAALKKKKLIDVDPEMVMDYIEPSEQERRLLQGEMLEEGMKLVLRNGGTSGDSEEKRGDGDAIFTDADEAVGKVIESPHESEFAKFERAFEALKKEQELRNTNYEELKRENQRLRSENTALALELEAYKNNAAGLERCEEEEKLHEDETMNEMENGDNQKEEVMKVKEKEEEKVTQNDKVMKEKENEGAKEEEKLQEDKEMHENENGDNPKDEVMKEKENAETKKTGDTMEYKKEETKKDEKKKDKV